VGDRNWYKCVKSALDKKHTSLFNSIKIEAMQKLPKSEQLSKINDHFAAITTSDDPLTRTKLPSFLPHPRPILELSHMEVYKELKRLNTNKSTIPLSIPSAILKECAMELCYVISHILNSSFESGEVPISWKTGYITALPKVSSVTNLGDLRPITVTSNIAKLAEKFINQHLVAKIIPQISKSQFGALPESSTTHYLVKLFDFLYKSLDKKSVPAVLTMFDCQKAFDVVDHSLMIRRFLELGVHEQVVNWLVSFLMGRRNCVRAEGNYSNFRPVTRGLAQGSLNGPLTFIVVFDPFLDRLKQVSTSNLEVFGFVDDSTAAAIETTDDPITQRVLEEALFAAKDIQMVLNSKKTITLKCDFTRARVSEKWDFRINKEVVLNQPTTKLLGVIINSKLTWHDHVDQMTTKASQRM
jgi:hypothetical protein